MAQVSIRDQKHIQLNAQTLLHENITSKYIVLHFGSFSKTYKIRINKSIAPGNVFFPSKLSAQITIPDLPFDHYFRGSHLFVGPVIGMLVLPLYFKDPSKQLMRFTQYNKIRGLVFLFTERRINKKAQTISGLYYNPTTNKFIKGTFPYPSAIFNRVNMKAATYKYMVKRIGRKIFNYPYENTDKWTFRDKLAIENSIKEHLPYTIKYSNTTLEEMVTAYDELYLKPTSMAGGNGILHIKRTKEGYILTDTSGTPLLKKSFKALSDEVERNLIGDNKYIIQQAIPYYYKSSKIDFRVYLQKGQTQSWEYSGMETKVAQKGSIISNSMNRERIQPGESTLKSIYGLNDNEIQLKVNEISSLCMKVLEAMRNPNDHYGDAAIDIVIDNKNKVWLLEVQFNYAAEIKAKRTDDERQILPIILPKPFEYAKALAGFKN